MEFMDYQPSSLDNPAIAGLVYLGVHSIVGEARMPEGQVTTQQADAQRKKNMQKVVRRTSVVEQFEVTANTPIPEVPVGGARVRIHYAGACYTERQILKAGRRRPKMGGIQDTSLYAGYEISGKIDSLCNTVQRDFKVGDRVIVYPEQEDDMAELQDGYAEYLKVSDVRNLVRVPESLSLEVAAMLPSGALTAYSAVQRLAPFIEHKVNRKKEIGPVNILVVGAGALGLWTITLAKYVYASKNINIACADSNIEKLMIAKEHGCNDVIHWNDSLHEEYLIERTNNVCCGGVDIIMDFSSSPRTINRSMKVLGYQGVLVVGGHSKYECSFCLHSLAQKQQCILGASKGTRDQLEELVDLVANNKVKAPTCSIFPVDDVNKVFEQLNQCKINGRAVLEICPIDSDDLA